MNIRYRVELSQAERSKLTALLNGGKHSARKLTFRARSSSAQCLRRAIPPDRSSPTAAAEP